MIPVTTGTIAKDLGADRDAVSYAIRKIGAEPIGRAGIVRMFDPGVTKKVKAYLELRKAYLGNRPVRRGMK